MQLHGDSFCKHLIKKIIKRKGGIKWKCILLGSFCFNVIQPLKNQRLGQIWTWEKKRRYATRNPEEITFFCWNIVRVRVDSTVKFKLFRQGRHEQKCPLSRSRLTGSLSNHFWYPADPTAANFYEVSWSETDTIFDDLRMWWQTKVNQLQKKFLNFEYI